MFFCDIGCVRCISRNLCKIHYFAFSTGIGIITTDCFVKYYLLLLSNDEWWKMAFFKGSGCLKHSSVITRFCVSKIVAIQFCHRQNTTPQALICLAKSHLGCLILMRKSALQRLSALVENL